jgi:hypothetical protein
LGDEIDPDAFGADQADDLFDFFQQGGRCVVEQEMGFVEEKDEAGFFRVADLGQLLEELGEDPQQKCRVGLGRRHEPVGGQDVDLPFAREIGLDQIRQGQAGSPNSFSPPWLSSSSNPRWMAPMEAGRHLAVLGLVLGGVVADVLEQGAQVLEVQQQQALVVGHAEHDRQDPGLDVVQVQQTGQGAGAPSRRRWRAGGDPVARTRPKTSRG